MAKSTNGGGAKAGKACKLGRNKAWCKGYLMSGTREKNKARKQARHQKRVEKKRLKLEKDNLEVTNFDPVWPDERKEPILI